MKRNTPSPLVETDQSKRPRIEDTISTIDLQTRLLTSFKETKDEKLRKTIVIQAINNNNFSFFIELLDAYQALRGKELVQFIITLTVGRSLLAAAIEEEHWEFLAIMRDRILTLKPRTYTKIDIECYFLYVAIYANLPLQTIQNLQAHFNIQYLSVINIHGRKYNYFEQLFTNIKPEGEPTQSSVADLFQFLWGLLNPLAKENLLNKYVDNFNVMLFLTNQGIAYPASAPSGKKFAFLAKCGKQAECSALLDDIANGLTNIDNNPFKFISLLQCPLPIAEEVLSRYPILLTVKFFNHNAHYLPSNNITFLAKVIKLVQDPKIKHRYLVLLLVHIAKDDNSIMFLRSLVSGMELLEALASAAKRFPTADKTWAKKIISLRPSVQGIFWEFLTLLFITRLGKCLSDGTATFSSIIEWWPNNSFPQEATVFFQKVITNFNESKQKLCNDEEELKLNNASHDHYRAIIDFATNDIRYCNLVNNLLNQSRKSTASQSIAENNNPVASTISPELKQLHSWFNKLKSRYGEIRNPEKEVNDFLNSTLDKAVYTHISNNLKIEAQKWGINLDAMSEAQSTAFLGPMSQDLGTLLSSSPSFFHPGKESYWNEPNYVTKRVLQSLGKSGYIFLALLKKAIQSEFTIEQQQAILKEIQALCIAYAKQKTGSTVFMLSLYSTIANKHPDIEIKKESPAPVQTLGFFSESNDLKEKIQWLFSQWEAFTVNSPNHPNPLSTIAACYGFRCIEVEGSGNYFFNAIIHQIDYYTGRITDTSPEALNSRIAGYRALALEYILKNPSKYKEFVPGGLDNLVMNNHYQYGEWVDHLITDALANAMNTNMVIIRNTGQRIIIKVAEAQTTLFLGCEDLHYHSLVHDPQLGLPLDIDSLLGEEMNGRLGHDPTFGSL